MDVNDEDAHMIINEIMNPSEPNEKLKDAQRKYNQYRKENGQI